MESFAPKSTEISVGNKALDQNELKVFDPDKEVDMSKENDVFEGSEDRYDPDDGVDMNVSEKGEMEEKGYAPDDEIKVDDRKDDRNESEELDKQGGSYKEVSSEEGKEKHHMPSDLVSPLAFSDGPVIKIDIDDHWKTASWGNSQEARTYREKQRELIEQGKFREAVQMDIDDIHDKFGDKYDGAIAEMMEYVDKLEKEGKIRA